jgi:hypothetical protein
MIATASLAPIRPVRDCQRLIQKTNSIELMKLAFIAAAFLAASCCPNPPAPTPPAYVAPSK